MPLAPEIIESHGLSAAEYRDILRLLGREPNLTELGIFSVMWSEHCSYKSSRVHLKTLPTEGPQVIEGPGENAGVVDIGHGLAAVFKIESHNHPSFIEPYQGAATGVGGIIRDIFTMGARPIALLNSLHFGPLSNLRNQLIMEGVVAGIAGYGNCMGIPTVGGEVTFHEGYSLNPIVNAFCLGIAPADRIFRAAAKGPGNPVIYVGAKTGRDGIHGATMASEEFSQDSEAKRPTVQVGDPLMEKLLLEACLEAMDSGLVVGIQDMGAAGLTCSSTEMAARAGQGVHIDLAQVPQREEGMTPYEIMLSESQERMLLVTEQGREEEILKIFRKWDLDAVVIGQVTSDPILRVDLNGQRVVEIPNHCLTDEAPCYRRPIRPPLPPEGKPSDWSEMPIPEPSDYFGLLSGMMSSEHLCRRRWVWRQYDHMVRTNSLTLPGHDAAVLRLKGTPSGLAISLDGNCRHCSIDPYQGGQLAVAEACRNLAASGARPLAATNCLNFGNPQNPEIMWQFSEAVRGMGEACRHFSTPITGGNVSFYNETEGRGIPPTPVLGMIGMVDDVSHVARIGFRAGGHLIYLLGETRPELGGSIYLEHLDFPLLGPCPAVDLQGEKNLQDLLLRLLKEGVAESLHDLSQGGLGAALCESCFVDEIGADCRLGSEMRPDFQLFSESGGRVLISLRSENEERFLDAVGDYPRTFLGRTIDAARLRLSVEESLLLDADLKNLRRGWDSHLAQVMTHEASPA